MLDFLNENSLNINCDIACMTKDTQNFLEQYSVINLNCDVCIVSREIHSKLLNHGANFNCDQTIVTDYQGEFLQISGGILEDGADYAGLYVIIAGDVVLRGTAVHAFENSEGAVISGTLYYPDSCNPGLFDRVQGNKRPYPEGAFVITKNWDLERILTELPAGTDRIWSAGEISAFRETALEQAAEKNLRIACRRLIIPENLYTKYRALFEASSKELTPEGYTVTGPLTLDTATSVLYGTRLYVRGALLIDEKAAACLGDFESILVKGCATLPSSCAKAFHSVGKAESYRLYEGRLYNINGGEIFTHERLNTMVENGEKITLTVNGFAIFSEDVTARDMEAIASVSCNGFIILPGAAQGALSQRTESINGLTIDMQNIQQMTGMTLQELTHKILSGVITGSSNVNTDIYMLS